MKRKRTILEIALDARSFVLRFILTKPAGQFKQTLIDVAFNLLRVSNVLNSADCVPRFLLQEPHSFHEVHAHNVEPSTCLHLDDASLQVRAQLAPHLLKTVHAQLRASIAIPIAFRHTALGQLPPVARLMHSYITNRANYDFISWRA